MAKAKKSKRKQAKKVRLWPWLLLIVLAGGLALLYTTQLPPAYRNLGTNLKAKLEIYLTPTDLAAECGRIGRVLDAALLQSGLDDTDLLATENREESLLQLDWVVSFRRFKIANAASIPVIYQQIRTAFLNDLNIEVTQSLHEQRSQVESTIEVAYLGHRTHQVILETTLPTVAFRRQSVKGTVLIIIDDVGGSLEEVAPYLERRLPLTMAVIPQQPEAIACSKELGRAGYTLMVHQPMEAISAQREVPGSLETWMTKGDIAAVFDRNLAYVPGAIGVNNHMGSAFTSDLEQMTTFLEIVQERRLIFVDSIVVPSSKGRLAASMIGMDQVLSRDVFLDNEDDYSYIEAQFKATLSIATEYGFAVAIGHINRQHTHAVLAAGIARAEQDGYYFIQLNEVF